MNYRYCLFDLDGTLTESGIGIVNSVIYALEKFNIRVADRNELTAFIGPPLVDSFMKYFGFTEEQAQQGVTYYREYFRSRGIFENRVYDGITDLLDELRRRNVVIAIATSKPYEFSVKILKHFGLFPYFDYIGAASMDGSITKKEDVIMHLLEQFGEVDKSSVLMVGDRDQDVHGARANGLACAGVLWGYGSEEELKAAGADYLFAEPRELLKLF